MNPVCQSSQSVVADIVRNKKYVTTLVSFAHRNCFSYSGGIEHCVRQERTIANNRSLDYLLIVPTESVNSMGSGAECDIILNGTFLGCCRLDSLAAKLYLLELNAALIHSVIGFNPSILLRAVLFLRKHCSIKLWVHDLSYVCDSHVLIRDETFCGLRDIDDHGCFECEFHQSRKVSEVFFSRLIVYVDGTIFPSYSAKQRFDSYFNSDFYGAENNSVVPHYVAACQSNHDARLPYLDHVGIAFFGHNVFHKGWFKFLSLVDTLISSGRYKFYQVGTAHLIDGRVKHMPYSELDLEDPISHLRNLCVANNIRLAFFWSITLESFGLMFRQVLATQCAVLARGDDPALREFIDDCEKVAYFDTFDDLLAFAKDQNAVDELLNKAARTTCTLEESEYSFSFLR